MVGRNIALGALFAMTMLALTEVKAIEFRSLECAPVPLAQAPSYNVTVPCTAVVRRGGSGMWYNAPSQECASFCRAIASVNVPSPDGFRCTSGEARPWSAIGAVNYGPTGCWHDCGAPEGRVGAVSVGPRCYAPGQKRDNDRTDITVGCYCATGDIHSNEVDIGIHASGAAQSAGINHWVTGLTTINAAAMNDRPGRVSYIRGGISLSGEAVVHFSLNIQGGCGTSVTVSGRANGSGGSSSASSEVVVELPSCARECRDGVDNDGDGRIDEKDSGCDDAQDNSEDRGDVVCNSPVDHASALAELETIIRAQRVVVYELVDPLISLSADPAITTRAQELRVLADTIKRDLVRDMNRRYPKTTQQCSSCPTQNLLQVKMDLVVQSRRMWRLTRQVAVFARASNPGLAVRGNLQTADALYQRFREKISELPCITSQCS